MTVGQRRQRKVEETRSLILEAAARRFAERGFSETRLEDVGEDVGIGRSAVLYHFKEKRLLYRAVLDELFGGLLAELRSALTAAGTLAERVEAAVAAWVGFVGERPAVARILLREGAGASPERAEEIGRVAAPLLALLDRVYAEGRRDRVFRDDPVDPLHLVSAVVGATVFLVPAVPALLPQADFDPLASGRLESHRRELLTIVRRLLGLRMPRAVRT